MGIKQNVYPIISLSITLTLILGVISINDEDFSAFSATIAYWLNYRIWYQKSLDYVHHGEITTTSTNILLNGINLTQGEFILLYDSTPFGSKRPYSG